MSTWTSWVCLVWTAVSATACVDSLPPSSTTGVGNPGRLAFATEPGDGVDLAWGDVWVSSVVSLPCDPIGEAVVLAEGIRIPVLDGAALTVPPGPSCGFGLRMQDDLFFDGTSQAGGQVKLYLDIPTLDVFTGTAFEVDGDAFGLLLGAPGWLTAEAIGATGSDLVTIDTGSAVHDTLVDVFVLGSRVWRDADADGVFDEGEAIVARATPDDDDVPPEP